MNTLWVGLALLHTCNGCWQNVHIAIYQKMLIAGEMRFFAKEVTRAHG
jgi:hypothetical protein